MKIFFTFILLSILTSESNSQTSYTWNGSVNSSWTNADNWTPSRSSFSEDDVMIIDGSITASPAISNVPTESIGQLKIINNCSASFTTTAIKTLTLTGGSGTDFLIEVNSTLTIAGSSPLRDSLSPAVTGEIYGTLNFTGGAHRLFSADSTSVLFRSGGKFIASSNFTGNPFGNTGLQNRIAFDSGSVYEFNGGSNPFGLPSPASRVIFKTGSLYRHQSTLSPSFSGRTYANFELNFASANINGTGSLALTIIDLTITNGTLSLNLLGGVNVKGSLSVNAGSLNFNPVSSAFVKFNGASPQTIANYSNLSFGANANVEINNPSKVSLLTSVTFENNNFTIAANTLLESAVPNALFINCSSVTNNGTDSCYNTEFGKIGTQNISGSGIWKGLNMKVKNVTTLNLNADMKLDNVFGGFLFESGCVVNGSGILKTNGLCNFDLRGDLNTDLEIESDSTSIYDSGDGIVAISRKLIIDNNSALNFAYPAVINNDVLNNGALYSIYSIDFFGTELENNSTTDIYTLNLNDTSSLSGTGMLAGSYLNINTGAMISLESDFNIDAEAFTIYPGGFLNLNDLILTYSGLTFTLGQDGIILPSGTFRTQGTVSLDLRDTLDVELNINSGTAIFPFNGFEIFVSSVINVDPGAQLTIFNATNLYCLNNVNIFGTLAEGSLFFRGDSLYNEGVVSVQLVYFDDTTSVSGAGQWLSQQVRIIDTGLVKFENDMTFGNGNNFPNAFHITDYSKLNLNNKNVTLAASGLCDLYVDINSEIINGGKFDLYSNAQSISLEGSIDAELNIKSGITTFYNTAGNPFFSNNIIIDSLAALNVNAGYTLTCTGNITVNGDIQGPGTINFSGDTLINNGNSISVLNFNFLSGSHVIKGSGIFSSSNANFSAGSNVKLESDHQMHYIAIENGATFDISNKKLSISGDNGINNQGSFVTSGSLISFIGSFQYIPVLNILYNDIEINGAQVISQNTINMSGDLYLTYGQFFIVAGDTLNLPNGSTIYIDEGYFNLPLIKFNSSVNIVYNGDQQITTGYEIPTDTNIINNMTINNPAGIIAGSNISLKGNLALTSGDLDLNGFNITLSPSALLTETPGNTVKGNSGYLTTTRNINSPSNLNVGGMGAVLTSAQNLGSTKIFRGHSQQTSNGNNSILRFYDILPFNNSNLNASVKFYYDESELNNLSESELRLYRSTDVGTSWSLRGGSRDTLNNNITLNSVSSFSRWTLADFGYKKLELTLFIEGFYNSNLNTMISDTISVYLRNEVFPFDIVDSSRVLLSDSGKSEITFIYAQENTNYYLQINHRNSIETWSNTGQLIFNNDSTSYNFSSAAAKSFGNNMIQIDNSPLKFAIYSGDVNQDGFIDLSDVVLINNDANIFVNGYVKSDVTGNNITDLTDVLMAYNNSVNFVSKILP